MSKVPDVELFPGALEAVATDKDTLIIHCVHGVAAIDHHIQGRNVAAQL